MNLTLRTKANLVAVAVVSAGLILYAVTRLLLGFIGEAGYPLALAMPTTGGIAVHQQVSVDGRLVGEITELELTDGGVLVHLAIDEEERVPVDATVRVLRRSVIGEQVLDFVTDGPPRAHHEAGDVITPSQIEVPVNVQDLLELADSRLGAVAPEQLAGALSGLADAVEGRREDLGRLVRSGGDLAGALASSEAEVVRLLSALREVSAEVAAHRETAVRSIDELATAVEVLGAIRGDVEGLLAAAPPVLGGITDVLDRGGADLGCLVRDTAATAALLNSEGPRTDLERSLALNQWFFTGIAIGAPFEEASGAVWVRVRLLLPPPQAAAPDTYLPAKRPIPRVRPGGACVSALGVGAPAAAQDGWRVLIPDGGVEPPEPPR